MEDNKKKIDGLKLKSKDGTLGLFRRPLSLREPQVPQGFVKSILKDLESSFPKEVDKLLDDAEHIFEKIEEKFYYEFVTHVADIEAKLISLKGEKCKNLLESSLKRKREDMIQEISYKINQQLGEFHRQIIDLVMK